LEAVPAAVRDLLASNPALLAALLDDIAKQTGCGNTRRCAGILRGKRAGRRVISEDDRLIQHVSQLVAAGHTSAEALKLTAASQPGHSYTATLDRIRRKWRRHCDNRREQRGDFILHLKKA
jgi:hypothetical protein